MKILTDKQVIEYLDSKLSQESILKTFQPTLLKSLGNYHENPQAIPPRTVQQSATIEDGLTHLFMPCVAPSEVGIKLISGGPSNNQKGLGFQGAVIILNEETGELEGIVNAKTLTAFRTALATSIGMVKAIDPTTVGTDTHILPSITVFGVGLQAYWHVKLALLLYADHIKSVKIVNRSLESAKKFAGEISKEFTNVEFSVYSWQDEIDSDLISESSSIIFGCTPSTEPIIKESYINKDPKYKTFIGLIGSYKPHMIELDLGFIIKNYKDNEFKPKIIVDSKEHTLDEAGELIQSGIQSDQLIELTELEDLTAEAGLEEITTKEGNVTVSKIVGLSIMDISIGKLVLDESKIGTEVDDF